MAASAARRANVANVGAMPRPSVMCLLYATRPAANHKDSVKKSGLGYPARTMLAVPCGLPSYMGAWPPVSGGALIEPLADLAACTPHSSASAASGQRRAPAAPDTGRGRRAEHDHADQRALRSGVTRPRGRRRGGAARAGRRVRGRAGPRAGDRDRDGPDPRDHGQRLALPRPDRPGLAGRPGLPRAGARASRSARRSRSCCRRSARSRCSTSARRGRAAARRSRRATSRRARATPTSPR